MNTKNASNHQHSMKEGTHSSKSSGGSKFQMSGKLMKSKGDDIEDEELLDFRELDQLALMH